MHRTQKGDDVMGIYIPPEDVEYAKRITIFEFLSRSRPLMYENLKRVGSQYAVKAKYYGTKGEYSSFLIRSSDGYWWHHSKGTHGKNALDYLVKEEGMDFQSAVLELLGRTEEYYRNGGKRSNETRRSNAPKGDATVFKENPGVMNTSTIGAAAMIPPEKKELVIPERDQDTKIIRRYLEARGISPEVIDFFIDEGSLYQGAQYKNVCFVGYDRDGAPRLINQRATRGSFKGNTTGSDRRYSFMHHADGQVEVHLFEAPIDMLSFASLIQAGGYDFRKHNLLSLSGISGTGSGTEIRLPMGMAEYLERFPDTAFAYIHFDNDEAGKVAGERMQKALAEHGVASKLQYPPEGCKDVNDYLVRLRDLQAGRSKTAISDAALIS